MRNRTSALRRADAFLGLKLSAICRTMLFRYPGNGNSIPSLRTVATSVPFPPVGPPPAFGASLFDLLTVFSVAAPCFAALAVGFFAAVDGRCAGFATVGVESAGV